MAARDRIRLRQIQAQAEGYLELGMPQHTLDTLARLGDPADLGSHASYLCGTALQALGRYDEALAALNRSAELVPDNIHVWLALGWSYKRIARLDLAVEALEQALAVDPSEPIVHYNLACYLSLVANKPRALAHLAEALTIDPQYRDLVDQERDFDPIRSDPEFQVLTSVIV